MVKVKLNLDKIRQLPTANALLDEKYGEIGTEKRKKFSAKAKAWYYAELDKNLKEAGITQKDGCLQNIVYVLN